MTCNPAWPEITRSLIPDQNSTDRHDLTARVFKVKLQKLDALLTKGKIFDKMDCFMYLIEWQKKRDEKRESEIRFQKLSSICRILPKLGGMASQSSPHSL
ncbi:helitron_like_N domain-containing protein [Trichonephila clavipes]|uniref:Helitron_like_N domain-containing protein n=1 Tax=Trichonephila clavipes TaxID=2585209 RepID=A0A8X6RD92_TRICX|nr:helitron_like_N domain-containing protein [Trichonephila clavipes]